VARDWARVMPPSSGSIDLTAPLLTLPTFRLLDMGGGISRGQYDGFTASGIYQVFVYARDLSDFQSIPKMLSVNRNCGITVLMGDINGDEAADLEDAVIALRVLAGVNVSGSIRSDYATPGIDVTGNSKIGLDEAVWILRHVAGF
ncbi:MAG: hypothetical protein AB7S75_15335, partial [Desulfococcaceae bacterium]